MDVGSYVVLAIIVAIIIGIIILVYYWYSVGSSIWDFFSNFGLWGVLADAIGIDKKDPDFCKGKDRPCFNNCIAWLEIDKDADKYCANDLGSGWKSAHVYGQENCNVGFGKAQCMYDESRKGTLYNKNCIIWSKLDRPGADNMYCQNDYGDGWASTGNKERSGCGEGMGQALCKHFPEKDGQKFEKNCRIWDDIWNNGDRYCSDDYGSGWKFSYIREQTDCDVGQGRGICIYDSSRADSKYVNNCVIWKDLENNHDKYCKNDFGEEWSSIGIDRGGCNPGFGKALCKIK